MPTGKWPANIAPLRSSNTVSAAFFRLTGLFWDNQSATLFMAPMLHVRRTCQPMPSSGGLLPIKNGGGDQPDKPGDLRHENQMIGFHPRAPRQNPKILSFILIAPAGHEKTQSKCDKHLSIPAGCAE
ncbi:hypothetical protein [Paracoccus sp. (in: a-proteobacteria)]|uniref:hypothetical protein n=1 Tax=Paracoccus sp. TaxID=267 RepID=UPI002AFE7540|nr:hypothetical protein [Paracoccus sp. (in: a-proteobacteria)]